MSEIKLISPILDNFCIGDPISDKNGVRSCPAMKENEDDRYILKVISIPASQTKLDALLLTGAYPSAEAANEYFKEQTDSVIQELEALNSFTEQDGFYPVLQWQTQPMEDGETGYDVDMLDSWLFWGLLLLPLYFFLWGRKVTIGYLCLSVPLLAMLIWTVSV